MTKIGKPINGMDTDDETRNMVFFILSSASIRFRASLEGFRRGSVGATVKKKVRNAVKFLVSPNNGYVLWRNASMPENGLFDEQH